MTWSCSPSHRANAISRLLGGIALTAAAFGCPDLAIAEEAPPDSLGDVQVEETQAGAGDESILFEDIASVVGASKFDQPVTQAPSAVTIIDSSQIQRFGYQTLADALNSVQGVFTTYDRNYSYGAFRGFGRPGDYNSRILLLVDGHRLNDSVYDGALIGTEFPVDVDLIDRIEVIRGPASSLYGTNAFFGVVNVITRRGRDLQGAEVGAGGGSQETWKARGSAGWRFENGAELLVSGSYRDSEGDDALYYSEFDDPSMNFGVVRNADDDTDYDLLANASFREFTLQVGHGSREKVIPTAPFLSVFPTEQTLTVDTETWADLRYDRPFDGGWTLRSRAYYDRYYYTGDYLYDNALVPPPDLVLNVDETTAQRWGSELSLERRFFDRHRVTAGGEVVHSFDLRQKNYDRAVPPAVSVDSDESELDWALYLQDEFMIFENLILNAGVRYDRQDSFGSSTNPRAALIYNPFESTTLKLIYGRAFRAPSAYELFYESATFIPNPDLDPEEIQTAEFVFEQELGPYLRFVGSAYYSEIDDLITLTTLPSGDLMFLNAEDLESHGIELRLDGRFLHDIAATISYSAQRTQDDDFESRLTNSPQHLAKFHLSAPLLTEYVFAGTELLYMSKRKTVKGFGVGDHFVANLTLSSGRLPIEGLKLAFSVRNLFDNRYSDPASEEHTQNGIEQDGRLLFVEASYGF
jgi:iron complex outermembrane receptor protein